MSVTNGYVRINKNTISESDKVKQKYRIYYHAEKQVLAFLNSQNIRTNDIPNETSVNVFISESQRKCIENSNGVDSCILIPDTRGEIEHTFFNNRLLKWTYADFGPLLIPAKGHSIILNSESKDKYDRILTTFEGLVWNKEDCSYLNNGRKISNHTFKQDYFFFMGDNRENSVDSRCWGLIPREKIVGEATHIIFSEHNGNYRWKRAFKKIK